jgi:hypothetical protein
MGVKVPVVDVLCRGVQLGAFIELYCTADKNLSTFIKITIGTVQNTAFGKYNKIIFVGSGCHSMKIPTPTCTNIFFEPPQSSFRQANTTQ